METPPVHGLLDVWERGQSGDAAWRGLLLLRAALPGAEITDLAALTLGRRNRLLLDLRVRLFGAEVDGLATCTTCAETLETSLTLPSAGSDDPVVPPVHELAVDGWLVRYRLPTTADLIELPPGDADDAAGWLLERCIVAARCEDDDVAPATLPDDIAGMVTDAMGALDPDGVVELIVDCPQCGSVLMVPFEPGAFLWAELDQWAWRTLADVADLASAYGWSEADILLLSPWRRQVYLELLSA